MKEFVCPMLLGVSVAAFADTLPVISDVTMTQRADRKVKIAYKLTAAPAIVTVDVQTNRGDNTFVSISGSGALRHLTGHFSQVIQPSADETRLVMWDPETDWAEQAVDIASGNVRAVVTAYPTNTPPDYLVVNMANVNEPLKYYSSPDFLPRDIHDDYYLTNSLVMRKIPASQIKWHYGTKTGNDGRWAVLTKDFYIGVYEMTGGHLACAGLSDDSIGAVIWHADRRPACFIKYSKLRGTDTDITVVGANSHIGKLRTKYGLPFDIPTRAQWEFACRAGCGEDLYDGTPVSQATNAKMKTLGRFRYNSGMDGSDTAYAQHLVWAAEENYDRFTARPGTYKPNAFGLYDMYGNVAEWCVDYANVPRPGEKDSLVVDPCGSDSSQAGNGNRYIMGASWTSWNFSSVKSNSCPQTNTTELYSDMPHAQGYRLTMAIPGK